MLIFSLNLEFYYIVKYAHKYLYRQRISTRKNRCFIVYTTVSPAGLPSVTSELIVSVQPAMPVSPISVSLEIRNTFIILGYSEAKYQSSLLCGTISDSDIVFLFLLQLSQVLPGYALCTMQRRSSRPPKPPNWGGA